MQPSSNFSKKDISQITTYQSGIAQASAHRVINRVVTDFLLQYGLTSMQWFVIGTIYDSGDNGLRLSDLMRKVNTTLPYITNTVSLLESKGIIKKISHTGDSRIKLVSVAENYKKTVEEIEEGLRDHLRDTLYRSDGISREELNNYIAVLYKIVGNSIV
ncbi:MAG TPA: MarR family transcriptional regulator [Candidatus Saccharimonadales bacterium]